MICKLFWLLRDGMVLKSQKAEAEYASVCPQQINYFLFCPLPLMLFEAKTIYWYVNKVNFHSLIWEKTFVVVLRKMRMMMMMIQLWQRLWKIQCPNIDNCNVRIGLHFSNNAGIVVARELITASLPMLDPLWWICWAMTDSDGKGTRKLITFPN